jgi:hypothetical protein
MKVRLTTARHDFRDGSTLAPGDELEVDDALAERMIDAGQAERIESSTPAKPESSRRTRRVVAPTETR